MKIYMLLMLMAVFVGFSYAPVRSYAAVRSRAEPRDPVSPDSPRHDAESMNSARA
jgi:hypothetical protein